MALRFLRRILPDLGGDLGPPKWWGVCCGRPHSHCAAPRRPRMVCVFSHGVVQAESPSLASLRVDCRSARCWRRPWRQGSSHRPALLWQHACMPGVTWMDRWACEQKGGRFAALVNYFVGSLSCSIASHSFGPSLGARAGHRAVRPVHRSVASRHALGRTGRRPPCSGAPRGEDAGRPATSQGVGALVACGGRGTAKDRSLIAITSQKRRSQIREGGSNSSD